VRWRCGSLRFGSTSRCMLALVIRRCTNFTRGLGVVLVTRHGLGRGAVGGWRTAVRWPLWATGGLDVVLVGSEGGEMGLGA
jgi:hypothetical protein